MIDCTKIPQVSFDEMNRVHYEEARLLNKLEELLINAPDDSENIAACLHEMIEHTRGHFGNEERLMKEVGFPAFNMHEGEHIRVFNEMQRIISQWLSTKDNNILKEYFLGSFQEWLSAHILSMDTMTAQFIYMHKGC